MVKRSLPRPTPQEWVHGRRVSLELFGRIAGETRPDEVRKLVAFAVRRERLHDSIVDLIRSADRWNAANPELPPLDADDEQGSLRFTAASMGFDWGLLELEARS